jgi:CRP/FNR family cyclic AMP-dependent transcriptional regulator
MFSTSTNNKISFTDLLAECGDLLELDRGETIYHPGTPSSIIYLVESGRVKLAYLDESGKKLTLRIVDEGEIFGEMCLVGEAFRRHLATSIEDTVVRSIEKKKFLKIMEDNPDGLPLLVNHFAARTTEFEETLEDLAFRDIQARLSRQLLKLSDDYGVETKEGILIGISVTHKELADMIGSARENTTLALNRFAREGILDKSRYRIIIKSEDGLRKKISAF